MKRQHEQVNKAAKDAGKVQCFEPDAQATCQLRESDDCSRESNANAKDYVEDLLIEKMCVYLAKMALHDEELSQ